MSDANLTLSTFDELAQTASPAERAEGRLSRLQNLALALTSADSVEQAADVVRREGFTTHYAPTGEVELRWPQEPDVDTESHTFMQIVAQMCAHALERARLYEAERTARRLAEQATERTTRLQNVTAGLAQAVTLAQVGEIIISEGTSALDAHRGVLALLNAEADHLEVAQAWGYSPDNARVWQRFPLNSPIPLSDVVRSREPVWLHDLNERNSRYPQLAQIQTTSQAYAVLPLLVEDRVLGGINFGFDHPRRFDPDERAFITALAQQCAQALERARLTDVAASRLSEIEQLNARLKQALAETHHRVKNNLQVISALVELQTDVSEAMVPAEALRRVGGHARALATLHDLLTDQAKSSFDMSTVSTRALFGKMLPLLQSTIGERALSSEIEEVRLPVRIGASLCLLANELVSNAVKHGGQHISFTLQSVPASQAQLEDTNPPITPNRPDIANDEISPGLLHLIVADDGPGFPPDFNPQKAAHTGLDLVSNLSRLDLGGSVAYANNPQGGARVIITFPLPE